MTQRFDPSSFDVIHSDLVPPDRIFLAPRGWLQRWYDGMDPMSLHPEPVTVKGQATKIVHEGMADTVAWLKAAGHTIPSWTYIDDMEQRRVESSAWFGWRYDAHASMTITNPRSMGVVTS